MSGNESGTFVSQVRRALIHYYWYSYLFIYLFMKDAALFYFASCLFI